MHTWHVTVEFEAATAFDEDIPFDVAADLGEYGAVMSVSPEFNAGSIILAVDAESALDASALAAAQAVSALTAHGIEPDVTSVRTQRQDAFEAELAEPIFPEVVGYAEIAGLAGVSRQRARQFAEKPTFPRPVIVTAQGPLYGKHAVERWVEHRNTRTGRPRKLASV